MNKTRMRIVGLAGFAIRYAIGWHEGFGHSLASWAAVTLCGVSVCMLLETVPVERDNG
jgi:hypothetical protein